MAHKLQNIVQLFAHVNFLLYLCRRINATNTMNRRIFSIVSALVLSIGIAYAYPHQMRNLGEQDGLSDLLVNCIHVDDIGMTWLGTSSSVEMFDGVRVRHFELPGKNGPQKRVTAIVGDPNRGLWAGNGYGLWWHNIETESFEQRYEQEIIGGVTDLVIDSMGALYVATTIGLYIIENDAVTSYRLYPKANQSTEGIRAISIDENGIVWMTTSEGLHAMLPNRQILHFTGDKPDGGYTCLAAREGTVWLGTFHNGLYAFDISTSTFRQERKMIVPVSGLQACEGHKLLIGTDGNGVIEYDAHARKITQRWTQNSEGSSKLTSNSVYSLYKDTCGILWVGLYQHGLDYTLWQGDRLNVHKTPMFDSEGVAVRALCIHNQQRLIGTRQGLYFIDKATRVFRHFDEDDLDAQIVFAIHRYGTNYYIGTYGGGLWRLNPTTMQLTSVSLLLLDIGQQIFCLTEDSLGRLWVGSERGAYCLEMQRGGLRIAEQYNARNSQLPAETVYAIFFDQEGRGWICTTGGMALYDASTQSVRTNSFPSSFPSHMVVRQVWQDRKGSLYFVPEKGDLFAIDNDWHALPVPEIEGAEALFITEDGNGHLLVGTNKGLYYAKEDNNVECLDFFDGLPSSIFTLCQPQTDEEGTVWLGNSEGLIWFKPDSITMQYAPRHILITGILTNHTPLSGNAKAIAAHQVRLPKGSTNLTVYFSDLSYSDPSCMKYEYQLEGQDTEWRQIKGVSELSWHNLRSGRYTLRLRCPGEPKSEYMLRITIPMSNEMLYAFIALVLLLLVLTGTTLEIRRHHRVRKQAQEDAEEAARAEAEKAEERKYKTANIPVAELRKLKKQVDALMAEEQMYLNPELKLSDIANRLNTSSFVLSYLFNQHMGTSFYDYINLLRVEYFKQRVKLGETKLYTLDALATRCGYNSRTSFFRNFKKATGMTPSEWISQK